MNTLNKKLKLIGQGCLLSVLTVAFSGSLFAQALCQDVDAADVTAASAALLTIGTGAGQCGDGKLDAGECCDLGTDKNGIDDFNNETGLAGTDTKMDHGCNANCTVDTTGGWQCNDPQLKFTGYNTEVQKMNDLVSKVQTFVTANPTCDDALGSQVSTGVDSYDPADVSPTLTTCADYEQALKRLQSYNKSHVLTKSVYATLGGTLNYRGASVVACVSTAAEVADGNDAMWVDDCTP